MALPCFIVVEENCCPAWEEPRLSCKPQHYQENEEDQNFNFCKFHFAQLLVLFFDDFIGLFLLSLGGRTDTTTKILLKTGRKWMRNIREFCQLSSELRIQILLSIITSLYAFICEY